MKPEEFVESFKTDILADNMRMYCEAMDNQADMQQWPHMIELWQELSPNQKKLFLTSIEQIIIDTLSNVLGILDGSTVLGNCKDYFHLTYGDDKHELNGDLQDLFLGDIQDSQK